MTTSMSWLIVFIAVVVVVVKEFMTMKTQMQFYAQRMEEKKVLQALLHLVVEKSKTYTQVAITAFAMEKATNSFYSLIVKIKAEKCKIKRKPNEVNTSQIRIH